MLKLTTILSAFKDAGKLDEAIEAYRNAIDLNSDFSEPYNNLAVVFKMQVTRRQ